MSDKLFSNATAKWYGWIDGRKGIPSLEDNTPTPFENRGRNKANQIISKIYGRWQKIDSKLHSKLKQVQNQHDRALGNYEQSKDASGRDPRPKSRGHYVFIAILGLVELFINSEVFAHIGLQNYESWVMALVLLAVPVAGDYIGRLLKEDSWNATRLGLAIATAVASLSTITLVSLLRATAIQGNDGSALDVKFWLFYQSTNTLVYLVAILKSYDYYYEKHQGFREEKEAFEEKERNLHVLAGRCESHLAVYKNLTDKVNHRYKEFIYIYRHANIRARKDGVPEAFKQMPPDLEVPSFDLAKSAESKPALPKTTDDPSASEISKLAASEGGHSTNQKLKPEEGIS